ncbi:MAG: metallophosphoesterase [Candidatus Gastranaerophilaceae bacterium]
MFVVFSGDNIDSPKTYYLPDFVKIINRLNVPYYIIIGNHDVYKNNGLSKAQYLEIIRENNFSINIQNLIMYSRKTVLYL